MKTKKNRFKVDKLFVLGAGASYSATRPNKSFSSSFPPQKQTPLDKHFTKALIDLDVKRPLWVESSVETIKDSWKDHIDFTSLGLEEAILIQAANMKFAKAIRPRRSRNSIEFEDYLNYIAHLITFYLRRARQGSEGAYDKFVGEFFQGNDTHNRIITFNYDDVLDNALLDNIDLKNLYFSNLKPNKTDDPSLDGSEFPVLLKLHGSVNWNCMTDDFKKMIKNEYAGTTPYRIGDIWYRYKGCPEPEDDTSPCIIPPIESKPITSIKLFNFLWTRACEYLHECKELYVCGYSLPPTDNLAASLFKEFNNTQLETVTVIDPDPSVMVKWRKLLTRSNISKTRWVYYAGFNEFVADL